MRVQKVLAALLLGAAIAMPSKGSAQVSVNIGARLGPEVSLYAYSQPTHGDWQTTYKTWTPSTVYYYNGKYYHKSVSGARAVSVYSHNGEYFMPPEDKAFVGKDKRYNYKRAPKDDDRGRAMRHDDNGRGRP